MKNNVDSIPRYLKSDYELLKKWVSINSGSLHLEGLQKMSAELQKAFAPLNASFEELPLKHYQWINQQNETFHHSLAHALSWKKRPEAAIQVFLCGHMDTVFGPQHPFQKGLEIAPNTFQGPGAADMKGGLIVMLRALITLEESPWAKNMGWHVLIVPDEEIGSVGSKHLFYQASGKYDLGLIFESSYNDGALVSSRKGSIVFSIKAKGVPAHVGRAFHQGKNAIQALARVIVHAESLLTTRPTMIFNVGEISGGHAVNVVPDEAVLKANLRSDSEQDQHVFFTALEEILKTEQSLSGVSLTLVEHHNCPPKPFTHPTTQLFQHFKDCAQELGETLSWKPSGGVCDGNYLEAAGIPTVDTLGVIGGRIHTPDEYIEINSLTTRSQLTALFLLKLAKGEIVFKC